MRLQKLGFAGITVVILLGMGLSACGAAAASPTPTPVVETLRTQGAMTVFAELTQNAPTATFTPQPANTPTVTPTVTPTETPSNTPTSTSTPNAQAVATLMKDYIAYYLVYPVPDADDCTYYMKALTAYPYYPKTGNLINDITTALWLLFYTNERNMGVLQNPLWASSLVVKGIDNAGGHLNVNISGPLVEAEDYCTNKKMRDQIFTTIRQFEAGTGDDATIKDVIVWLDGLLLDDLLLE